MINYKEHIKLTGLYTFFAAFPAVLQLIVYPIIEGNDRLGAEDFGYLAVAEALLSFLVMFSLYGMSVTISRFYFDYKDNRRDYRRLVSTIFTGIILRSTILLAVVLIFADLFGTLFSAPALSDFRSYGHYLAIIAFNRTVIMVALSLYRTEKRVKMFVIISLLSGLARSAFQITGVLYFDMSFIGYLTGTAIGGGIASLSVIVYTYIKCGFSYSREINRHMGKYALPLFAADIVVWGILFVDRFMLMNDPEALGIYDNALKFAMGIQFISQGLAGYVQPELYRLYGRRGEESDAGIRSQSNLFMAENIVVIALLIIPVMLFITWFYETSLVASSGLLALVFSKYLLYAQFQIFLWPILYLKRSGIYLTVNLIVFSVVLLLNLLLVPYLSYYGSIAASITGGVIQVLAFYTIQQRLMPFPWNKTKLLYFPLSIIGLLVVTEAAKQILNLNSYLASGFFVAMIFFGLALIYRRELQGLARKYVVRKF